MTQGEPIRELYLTRDILKQPLSSEKIGGIGDYGVSPVRSYRHSGGNRKAMAGPGTYPIGIFKSVEDAVVNGYLPLKTSKDIVLGTTNYPKGSKLEDLIQGSSSISKGIANTILYYDSAQNLTSSSTLQFDGSDIKLTLLQEDSSAGLLGYTNDGTIVKSTWAKTQFNTNKLFSPSGSLNIGISEGTIFFNSASSGLFALFNTLGATIQNKITVFNGVSAFTFEVDSNLVLSSQVEDVLSIAPSGAITLYNYKDYISSSNINTTRFLVTEASGEIKHSSILFVDNNRVGIGTDIPEALLDVEGDAVINGTLTADTYANLYAEDIPFDNTLHVDDTHGLQSTNVQDAIDELEYKKVNVADLNTNLILFPTTFLDPVLPYYNIVSTTEDTRYDDVAQDIATAQITADDQEVAAFVSDTELIVGDVGLVNVTTIGKVRKVTGNKDAGFYFKVFKRNDAGVETEICKSDPTPSITTAVYQQFAESALFPVNTSFTYTDRIVVKWYAVLTGTGNDPIYQFQIGGSEPVRILIPVPASAVVNSLWSTDTGQDIYYTEGNVGIGTQTPTQLLDVEGTIKGYNLILSSIRTGTDAGIVAYDSANKLIKSSLYRLSPLGYDQGSPFLVTTSGSNGVIFSDGAFYPFLNNKMTVGAAGRRFGGIYLDTEAFITETQSNSSRFKINLGNTRDDGLANRDAMIIQSPINYTNTRYFSIFNASNTRLFSVKAGGLLEMSSYGLGNVTGTESTFAAFQSDGKLIESQLITTDGTNVDIKNQLNVSGLTRRITLEGGLANAYIDANVGGNREWLNLQTVGGSYFKVNNLNSKISIETGGQPLEIIGRTAQGVTITTYTSAASVIPLRVKRHSAVALQRLQAWVDESDNILSTVDYRGWLGIGTSNPLFTLDIHSDNPVIRLNDNTSGDQHSLISNNSELRVQSTGFITFRPNNTPVMTILQNGNVGIGTAGAAQKLHLDGGIARFSNTASNWLDIDANYNNANNVGIISRFNGIFINAQSGAGAPFIALQTGSTTRLGIDSVGKVTFDAYGTGAITGTESTFPAFTAAGDIVESQLITTDGSNITVDGNLNITEGNAYLYDSVQALRLSKGTDTIYTNTIGGYLAGSPSSTRQTVFGTATGQGNTGVNQSAFGYFAGYVNTGANQSAFGYQAGYLNEGDNTVLIGYQAGQGNIIDNIFILKQNNVNTTSLIEGDFLSGKVAFRNYGTGTITGTEATFPAFASDGKLVESQLINTDGTNIGIGTSSPSSKLDVAGAISLDGKISLRHNINEQSWYVGELAGNNSNSYRSNAFGYNTSKNNTGDAYSDAFGSYALENNTAGFSNGFGGFALQNNTGLYSNGFGYGALQNNTGLFSNGFGASSLQNNSGNNSNGFGRLTLRNNSGILNTALGDEAGYETSTLAGSYNTFLGSNASYGTATTISNSTAVGANVTLTDSNTVILGNNANVGIGTSSPSTKLDVDGNIRLRGSGGNTNNSTSFETITVFESDGRLKEATVQQLLAKVPAYVDRTDAANNGLTLGETFYNTTDGNYQRV